VVFLGDFDNHLDDVVAALVGWDLVAPNTSNRLQVSDY